MIVREMFEKLGELGFMAVLIDGDGNHHAHMFDDLDKEEIGTAIRQRVRDVDAEVVVLISEAWAIEKPEDSMSEEDLRKLAMRYGSVAEHPWSKECVTLDFEFKGGLKEGYNWYIEEDGSGKRVLLDSKLKWANGTKVVEVSGHLQDFFKTLH